MNVKKSSFAAALIGLAVLTIGLSGASAKSTDVITITLAQATTFQAAQEAVDANFMAAYPNIKIQATYLPSGTFDTLLPTQLQAGTAPDIFFLRPGSQRTAAVWPLAAAGKLLDLSGRKWNKRMGDAGRTASFQGRVYAWPMAAIPDIVIYNADLFQQLNLKIPTSFAQMLAMCKTITAAGKIPFAQGFNDSGTWSIFGRPLYEQAVYAADPKWTEKRYAGKVTFMGTPGWHLALQRLIDMRDAGCFQSGAAGVTRPQNYPNIANGAAVMSIIATSEVPAIVAINPKLNYAFFNPPFAFNPAAQVVATPSSDMLAINKATQHPNEAKQIIDFFARSYQSTLFNTLGVSIAPYDLKTGVVAKQLGAIAPLLKAGKYRAGDENTWPDPVIFQNYFLPAIQGLITGQATINGTLTAMDNAWNAWAATAANPTQIPDIAPSKTTTTTTKTTSK